MSASAAVVGEAKPGLIRRYLPILHWLPTYQRGWFTPDAVAALSVWALLIPQGLAYATIAGVPVQYGLYTSFVALIAYAIFGTSRQLAQGPSGAVAAVSAAVIGPIVGAAALGTSNAVGYTAALALATGFVYLLLGLLRMGWISNFLSKAVLGGFVLGFAIGIIIDQSQKLLGIDAVSGTYVEELVGTIKELPETNLATFAVGAASLAALLLMRRFLKQVAAGADRHGVVHPGRARARPGRRGRGRDRDRPDRAVLGRTPRGGMERGRRPAHRGLVGGIRRVLGIAGLGPVHGPQASLRDRP